MSTVEELRKRQLAKEQELASLREKIKKQKRNEDYRQKMLLGGVVLMAMRDNPALRSAVLPFLEGAVMRSRVDRDRCLLKDVIDSTAPHSSSDADV